MNKALMLTVKDIQDTQVTAVTEDGQTFVLPNSIILGKPQLNQPLFLIAATTGNEAGKEHALAQTLLEHLLDSST